MPKPKKKKKKKPSNIQKRPLPSVEDGQYFCCCVKVLGNRRFRIRFPDGRERIGTLSGRVKRGQRVVTGTWVISSIRTYEPDATAKSDVFDVLKEDEVRELMNRGEIDKRLSVGINGTKEEGDDDDNVVWELEGEVTDEILDMI